MPLLLFALFILLPLAELYVIIQVGQEIGVVPTLVLLLIAGFAGAGLARSQGRAVWRRFNEALAQGRVPAREVFDGAMIIFGGALLLSPGFLTDIVGILLLLPPTRALFRRLIRGAARRTPTGRPVFFVYDRFPGTGGRSGTGGGSGSAEDSGERSRRRGSRSYDVEGSAREIDESGYGLDPGGRGSESDRDG